MISGSGNVILLYPTNSCTDSSTLIISSSVPSSKVSKEALNENVPTIETEQLTQFGIVSIVVASVKSLASIKVLHAKHLN